LRSNEKCDTLHVNHLHSIFNRKEGKMSISPIGRSRLSHKRPAHFNKFWFGCAYYPEHWDKNIIQTDPGRMHEAGFNVVRMAEFSWVLMEPQEGTYDFSVFDMAIEQLDKEGISTILCTPTATPPRWLTVKHPEILRVNSEGIAMAHGSRQHCCHANVIFRQYSKAITDAMAEHFKDNPNVIGWQTDNEFNCHFSECHCESCQLEFRKFLKEKYGDIDKLNEAWGARFWSQTYGSFDEILTPYPNKPTYVNPAHQLDYFRYLSFAVTMFQHDQIEILRKAQPKWFVLHNGLFAHIDYRGLFTQDLDVLGFDSYPQFYYDSSYRRFAHAFSLDRARAWSGNFIIPEQQSGPGGQQPYFHDNPEPGEIRRLTYTSIARGADSLLYFRWRTCRFGAEEYWCGILDHDNVPRRRYQEVQQIGDELSRVGREILGTSVRVDVAIATGDLDNNDAHYTLNMGLPAPDNVAEAVHRYFYDKCFAVGCVHPSDDLSSLRIYVIPHWIIVKPEWLSNLKQFAENGGILIIGARTGTRDINNNVIAETPPGILQELCGVTVEEYSRCNDLNNRPIYIKTDSSEVPIQMWYEVLKPTSAQIVVLWKGRHLDGMPAITRKRVGKGQVIYVGTYLTEQVIEKIMPIWIAESGLKPLLSDAPSGVEVVVREIGIKKIWFFINHTDNQVCLKNSPKGINLITGVTTDGALMLERNGVAVIRAY